MPPGMPPLFFREAFDRLLEELPAQRGLPPLAQALLVAHGRCIVHDVTPDTLPPLPLDVAVTGGKTLALEIEAAAADVPDAAARWDAADGGPEGDAIVAGLLEARMEAWYGAESLEAAERGAAPDESAVLASALERLDAAARAFDVGLEAHLDILSAVVGTPLLRNWRAMLPDRHEWLPWWLDGTLEATALRLEQDLESAPRHRGRQRGPSPRPMLANRCDDMPLRHAAAALAAEASGRGVRTIGWRSPDSTLRVTMYVPPRISAGDLLHAELMDGAGNDVPWRAVGTVFFLNGLPLHWRLGGGTRAEVVASWSWQGQSQLADDRRLKLVEAATGLEWERIDGAGE